MKGEMTVQTKEILTLLGFVVTIILGIANLYASQKTRYINNINSERIKWINSLREHFSNFNKNFYIFANVQKEAGQGRELSVEESYIYPEVIYYSDLIELYLNPRELVSKKIINLQRIIKKTLVEENFDFDMIKIMNGDIHYYQQVILKAEWKRLKLEVRYGREIDEKETREIYIETACFINNDRYMRLLKSDYESENEI